MDSKAKHLEPYISKEATQQDKFLKKYPKYDGRDILIAIIDASVTDISLPGMQKTTTGFPKVADCFDFCNRFIDTSIVEEVDADGTVDGLSGISLKLPSKWKNPSGKWHLGLFWFYCLYFKKTFESLNDNKLYQDTKDQENDENEKKRINKEIAKSRSSYYDCIVWNDGEKWQACIDTSYSDDLENAKILSNFEDEHEFGFFWDKISYCIKIHNDGNQLEIISSYYYPRENSAYGNFEHGTIVSDVAAAHFSGEPDKNGIAPGAQIVSMRYGNTTEKLKEALLKCIELGVDIINFSIKLPKTYEINEIIKEMTQKHGIIFILGAGNDGPLYSSMQEDYCSFHNYMFVIGSVLTAEMKKILYHDVKVVVDDNDPPNIFYYSSKGILDNGQKGLDFTAPGAVVTSVPQWSSNEYQYYNGTSVAAPNVTGLIACLISALKANSIPYSPEILKLALSNTAYLPSNGSKIDFGNGIIQIDAAFEYLKKHAEKLSKVISNSPEICIYEKKKKSLKKLEKNGIILIRKEYDIIKNYCIKLDTVNNNNEIQWQIKLDPEGSAKFIEYSGMIKNSMFNFKIDTKNLHNINYAEIHGYDISNISLGPLFHLPITVITPIKMTKKRLKFKKALTLALRVPSNLFISAPVECNRCIIKLTHLHKEKQNCIFIQISDIDRKFVTKHERLYFTSKKDVLYFVFPMKQQNIYEISFYRLWYKELEMFDLEISFNKIDEQNFAMHKKKRCNRKI